MRKDEYVTSANVFADATSADYASVSSVQAASLKQQLYV